VLYHRVMILVIDAGLTALLFAPKVAQVTATDITRGMGLAKTAELAKKHELNNVETKYADLIDLKILLNPRR